jgi:alkylation response protein AidB-like acyl-CoA dehydrogenase
MSRSWPQRGVAPQLDLAIYVAEFEEWLRDAPVALAGATAPPAATTEAQMSAMRLLMQALYVDGWSRYGWPEEVGGLGGTILHRAVMWEGLARHGVARMAAFEHLEVLGPTLIALGPAPFVSEAFPRFLDGNEAWAQGFSEPDAGSDLASLRTRAVPTGDGFLITGRKIWTSWAPYATWCLLLARTGTPESRHRGITAFVVDLRSPGVEVRGILQADGNQELAEVALDEVFVPAERMLGGRDGGWAVAMHILSHERGTFAWFRQCFLHRALLSSLAGAPGYADGLLGDAILDLASAGAAGLAALTTDEEGSRLGPQSAFLKLILTSGEQALHDWILATDPDLAIEGADAAATERRQAYLFSRIVSVYGGSREMQLDTIAKRVLHLP